MITAEMDLSEYLVGKLLRKRTYSSFFLNLGCFTCVKVLGTWKLAITCPKIEFIFIAGLLSKNLLECIC